MQVRFLKATGDTARIQGNDWTEVWSKASDLKDKGILTRFVNDDVQGKFDAFNPEPNPTDATSVKLADPSAPVIPENGEATIQSLITQGIPASEAVEKVNQSPRRSKREAFRGIRTDRQLLDIPGDVAATFGDWLSSGQRYALETDKTPMYAYEDDQMGTGQSIGRDPTILPSLLIGSPGMAAMKTLGSRAALGGGIGLANTAASDVFRRSGFEPGATPLEYGLSTVIGSGLSAAPAAIAQKLQKGRLVAAKAAEKDVPELLNNENLYTFTKGGFNKALKEEVSEGTGLKAANELSESMQRILGKPAPEGVVLKDSRELAMKSIEDSKKYLNDQYNRGLISSTDATKALNRVRESYKMPMQSKGTKVMGSVPANAATIDLLRSGDILALKAAHGGVSPVNLGPTERMVPLANNKNGVGDITGLISHGKDAMSSPQAYRGLSTFSPGLNEAGRQAYENDTTITQEAIQSMPEPELDDFKKWLALRGWL